MVSLLIALALASAGWLAANESASVIVISIDTLRADHLSAYGYHKIATPHIGAFAQRGTVFTEVSAQVPLTLPSHTSLFTSTYPFQNGVEENADVVPAGAVTLAAVLRARGYRTAAFIGSNMLDRRFGLDIGFEEYDSPFGAQRVRRDGALVLRGAGAWLSAHKDERVFLFIHLFDLHAPYRSPSANASSEPETKGYDAQIEYVDGLLGRFRETLERGGWWGKSMVVLLGDHGESLGDHGELSHGYFIYESTLHVPLIVHWPDGAAQVPERVTRPAGLMDVAPTVLDALHIPAPPSLEGVSLLKPDAGRAVYGESVYARDSFRWGALRSLRKGRWKYIEAPHAELYDLEKDPGERMNVVRENAAEAATLHSEMARLMARKPAVRATQDSTAGTKKTLRSLGYLAGSRKALLREGPDPKDRLAEYRMFDRALDALYSHRLDAAIRGLRAVLAMDRENLPARGSLGDAYLRAAKPQDAVRESTAALAIDRQYAPAAQALGEYYLSRRDWTKARAYLKQALDAAPGDSAIQDDLLRARDAQAR